MIGLVSVSANTVDVLRVAKIGDVEADKGEWCDSRWFRGLCLQQTWTLDRIFASTIQMMK